MNADNPLSGFIDAIAAQLKLELREELVDVVACALADHAPAPSGSAPPAGDQQVRGIDPHGLYTVEFVANRWNYNKDYVRDQISRDDLPRAPWRGGTIRYRGVDILRYEGVPEEELTPQNVKALPQASARPARRSSPPPAPRPRKQQPGTRVYNSDLPSLD